MLHICTATAALINVFDVPQCIAGQRTMPVVKLQSVEVRVQKQVMNLLVFSFRMCVTIAHVWLQPSAVLTRNV